MLIIVGGLPGTGKTTLSRELAHRLGAVYLRIDTIEQTILDATGMSAGETGYRIGYALAEENLRLGRIVVADCVNPLQTTRDAWKAVAARASVRAVEVEIVCSDPAEHRRRTESREIDIPGLQRPTWQAVLDRTFEAWTRPHLVIDTAGRIVAESLSELEAALSVGRTVV